MKHFFISYTQADKGWAGWIAWQLEAKGYSTVIQAWDFWAGSNFVLKMQRAIEETQRTIIVLSPDYLRSRFAASEWAAAFAQDPTGAKGRLLPVRVRNCQPGGLLAAIVYIDLVGAADRDEALARLMAGIKEARVKPALDPGLPPLTPATPTPYGAPEPPWPPALTLFTRVAGSSFWFITRIVACVLLVALAVAGFLSHELPEWAAKHSDRLAGTAFVSGVMVIWAAEAARRWWRRRHGSGGAA